MPTKPSVQTTTSLDVPSTRLLLALWEMKKADSPSELLKAAPRSKDPKEDYKKALQNLRASKLIAGDVELTLTVAGQQELARALKSNVLMPSLDAKVTVVGKKDYVRLLKWIAFEASAPSIAQPKEAKISPVSALITSYAEFQTIVLTVYDQLKRDYNYENLVPIYRIRREIGDRVSRTQFNEWLLDMQGDDILLLMEGSVEDGAADKVQDSVRTAFGELRCYAKRLVA